MGLYYSISLSNTNERAVGPLHWGPYCPDITNMYLPSEATPKCECPISFGISNLPPHVLSEKLNIST